MQVPRKLVLAGALLGLIPIALGVVGIATKQWTNVANVGLFNLTSTSNNVACLTRTKQQVIQGLEIGGVAAIAVGVIASVLLDILVKNRWIKLLPQILLILGPTAIVTGLILLLQCWNAVTFGYSIISMIAAGVSGYILAIYFALITCLGQHHYSSSTVIVRESVRF